MIKFVGEIMTRHRMLGDVILFIIISVVFMIAGFFVSNTYRITKSNQILLETNHDVMEKLTILSEDAKMERSKQASVLANQSKILEQSKIRFDQNDALSHEIMNNQAELLTLLKAIKSHQTATAGP